MRDEREAAGWYSKCAFVRYHADARRRPMVRFFAYGLDLSNQPPDTVLPDEVAGSSEPLMVVGAMAGA